MVIMGIDTGSKNYNVETVTEICPNGDQIIHSIHIWNQEIELTRSSYRRVDRQSDRMPLTDPHR